MLSVEIGVSVHSVLSRYLHLQVLLPVSIVHVKTHEGKAVIMQVQGNGGAFVVGVMLRLAFRKTRVAPLSVFAGRKPAASETNERATQR